MKYVGKTGRRIGSADDEIIIHAASADEAMQKLLGYSVEEWPKSADGYDAVCWVEDSGGAVVTSECVTINPDGTRNLDA